MIVAPKSNTLKRRGVAAPTIVQILPALVRGGVERGRCKAKSGRGPAKLVSQPVLGWKGTGASTSGGGLTPPFNCC